MGDLGSIPGLGIFPGEGKGYPPQYSGLENSMKCIAHGVSKSRGNWATFTVSVTLSKWMVGLFPSVSMFSKLFSIKFIPCHYMEVKWSKVAQSCPTLCDPMDGSVPGSCVHGIFQARIFEWVAIFFSRRSSWPRDKSSKKLTSSSVSLGEACKFTNISFVIYFSGKIGCAVQLGNLWCPYF